MFKAFSKGVLASLQYFLTISLGVLKVSDYLVSNFFYLGHLLLGLSQLFLNNGCLLGILTSLLLSSHHFLFSLNHLFSQLDNFFLKIGHLVLILVTPLLSLKELALNTCHQTLKASSFHLAFLRSKGNLGLERILNLFKS